MNPPPTHALCPTRAPQSENAVTLDATTLADLSSLAPRAFVQAAYQAVLGRPPTAAEEQEMLSSLVRGDSRAWLLGNLRYCAEGGRHGARIPGLRMRYVAQRTLRIPVIGTIFAWIEAVARLPSSFRRLRGIEQRDAVAQESLQQLGATTEAVKTKVESIFPPVLGDVLEVRGTPLASMARERFGLAKSASPSALTPYERYAMFETVFYESPKVAEKQRVYVQYLSRDLASRLPFLDLGCGRGEFLQILRSEGVATVGVDVNPTSLGRLRADGFEVVEADLIAFLEKDRRSFSGASLLQVAEHLTDSQIERLLALVAERLAPGAVLIVETPNPFSAIASAAFHTDWTHLRPLPPDRLRYQIEAAGFEQACTLFQARIPGDQFAGPDPRAYYLDYAIIASRSPS